MWERLILALVISSLALASFVIYAWAQRRRLSNNGTEHSATGQRRLLYFYGRHCPGCATQSRLLDSLGEEMQERITRIDAEVMPELARAYQVLTLPTTIVLDPKGQVAHINYGLAYKTKLEKQLALT